MSKIEIFDYRNIRHSQAEPSPFMNYVVGDNGSGKSSFLEAIYFGLNLKSFRTRYIKQQVNLNSKLAILRFELLDEQLDKVSLGFKIDLMSECLVTCKVNSSPLKKTSDLANIFPSMYVDPECLLLIDGPPSERRKFLDWGVFHVKQQTYSEIFRKWKQSFRQRNAILKLISQGGAGTVICRLKQELELWTKQYVELSKKIDELRASYFSDFRNYWLAEQCGLSSKGIEVDLSYYRGWSHKTELIDLLFPSNLNEINSKITTEYGPHKADLRIQLFSSALCDTEHLSARDYFSRGQKKLLASVIRLVQGEHFNSVTGRPLVLLIDDLGSELDPSNRKLLLELVKKIQGQKFFAVVSGQHIDTISSFEIGELSKMFHVKHGNIIEINSAQINQKPGYLFEEVY